MTRVWNSVRERVFANNEPRSRTQMVKSKAVDCFSRSWRHLMSDVIFKIVTAFTEMHKLEKIHFELYRVSRWLNHIAQLATLPLNML